MAKQILYLKPVAPDYQLRRGAVKTESTLSVQRQAQAIFDTSTNDSAGVANTAVGAHGLGVYLPVGAIIKQAYIQVKTAFTSVDSTATLGFQAATTNDLYAATAVSGAPGSTGFKAGVPDGTVTHMISLSAEQQLIANVAVEALTAGKAIIVVEYTLGL